MLGWLDRFGGGILGFVSSTLLIIAVLTSASSLPAYPPLIQGIDQSYFARELLGVYRFIEIGFPTEFEDQLSSLEVEEKANFMREIGLEKMGISKLIKEGYDLLNLETFFTSGKEESRAWTVKKNTLAPKAAGVIHSDFEKNFIRAEAVDTNDFIKFGSAEKCKENGKLRIEGKDYIVKDGDVLFFRVNP